MTEVQEQLKDAKREAERLRAREFELNQAIGIAAKEKDIDAVGRHRQDRDSLRREIENLDLKLKKLGLDYLHEQRQQKKEEKEKWAAMKPASAVQVDEAEKNFQSALERHRKIEFYEATADAAINYLYLEIQKESRSLDAMIAKLIKEN